MFRAFFVLLSLSLIFTINANAGGKTVNYEVREKAYEGYYISPSDNAPLVLLIHDWDGLTEYEVKRAEMLSEKGYAVFAVDLFGKGVRPTEVMDKRQHTGELYKDREKMRALLYGAMQAAKTQGANTSNAVAMGYCFGGAAVLEFARAGADLKGFVTFHGGLATPEGQDYRNVKSKILVFHGSADTAITMDDFSRLAITLEENNIPHEMITYGGAPHAFSVFNYDSYREKADKESWKRFMSFLDETL